MLRRVTTKHTVPEMRIQGRMTGASVPMTPEASSSKGMVPVPVSQQTQTTSIVEQSGKEWVVSFGAMMMPFLGFCYFHQIGYFSKSLDWIAKSRFGVHGFLAVPFITLSMEKCIYDTVQSLQGIDPNIVPEGRGGFPSGGSNLPSFSLVEVKKRI